MAKYLHVKNWHKHQHYKDRSPPWIKLHGDLLVDHEFACLQDASKLHLIFIWLLARHKDGVIPNDPTWIKKCAGLDGEIDLEPLISSGFLVPSDDASNTLAKCSPEERRGEAETEERRGRGDEPRPPAFASLITQVANAYQQRRYGTPDPKAKYLPVLKQEIENALETMQNHDESYRKLMDAIASKALEKDASFSAIAKSCGLKQDKKTSRPSQAYKDFTAERLAAQMGVG